MVYVYELYMEGGGIFECSPFCHMKPKLIGTFPTLEKAEIEKREREILDLQIRGSDASEYFIKLKQN